MKKLLVTTTICFLFAGAYAQDSMNKKMENKSDKMVKKMENPNDPMNKKIHNSTDTTRGKKQPFTADSVPTRSSQKVPKKKA